MKWLLCLLVLSSLGTATSAADNWPQFRGPTLQGMCDSKSLPLNWSESQNVAWQTPIHGKAWSSPVIWANQVWLSTATEDGKQLFALCLDKRSGKIRLDKKLFDVPHPQYAHPFNSYASPTPTIEEGRVYITFGSPGTACLDTSTGNVLWERRDLPCNHYRGAGSSPILWHNLLIMHFDGSDYQYVVGLDKRTGQTVWKTDRSIDYGDLDSNGKAQAEGDFRKAFATPHVVDLAGQEILLSLGSKALYAYEPATGAELWRVEVKSSFSGSDTPVVGDGLIFFTTGHGQSELLAVHPGGHGNVTNSHVVWRTHKHVPTRSSALFADGLLYMTSDAGILSCLEAATGKEVWHGRIDGTYSAAPLYCDGRVYFFNEDGKTTVLQAGREFKVLAENTLPSGFMASPAVSGDALFLRTKQALYRIDSRR